MQEDPIIKFDESVKRVEGALSEHRKVMDRLDRLPGTAFYVGIFVALFLGIIVAFTVMID